MRSSDPARSRRQRKRYGLRSFMNTEGLPNKMDNKDLADAMAIIQEKFGSRMGFLAHTLIHLSMYGQPCDLTFHNRGPMLDVVIDQQLSLALAYGAGAKKLREKLTNLKLSNGQVVNIEDIWTINPMPKGGLSEDDLRNVDMAEAEDGWGPDGEPLRQMIRETYRCKDHDEEDLYIRRFLAS